MKYLEQWRKANPDKVKEYDQRKRRRLKRDHPLYTTHQGIRSRCINPNHRDYPRYGGRGISMLPEWLGLGGFSRFEAWVMNNLGPRPEGMTLDRIDNDGNYEPGNLRWATIKQQNANRGGSK